MRFDLETRYNDYDTAGHVNNAVYLTYFEVARVKAWSAMVGARRDFTFVIAEASVRYVSRAQLGDPLAIDIRTAEVRDKAWVWSYRILDSRDGRLVADGRTVQVMFDFAAGTAVPIPAEIRSKLADV
jgi:acyl-CoA thioester hydrolase